MTERRPDRASRLAPLRALVLSEQAVAVMDQVVVSGMTFIVGVLAARLLGLDQFGRYAIVIILAGLAQGLHSAVIVMPMMTLAGLRRKRSANYYWALIMWTLAISVIAGLAVATILGVALGLRDAAMPWELMGAAAAYTATQNVHFTMRRLLFARRTGLHALRLDVARYVLLLAVGFLLWCLGAVLTLERLLWVLALTAALACLPLARRLHTRHPPARLLRTLWGRHWPIARWLVPTTILSAGHEQIIALGLGFVLSDRAVGGLRAGQYLVGATHFILMAMENFLPGGAARALSKGGTVALTGYLLRSLVLFGLPIGALLLLLSIYAEAALGIVFGAPYVEFAPILRIAAVSYACILMRDICANYFRAIERADVIFQAFLVGSILSLAIAYPVIATWDVTGAAIVILVGNLASMGFLLLALLRANQRATQAKVGT